MGLTATGLSRFADTAAGHVGPDRVPGLVALVAHGDDVHVEALGERTLGGPPVTRDTLFRIASTTKPVTAVTAAQAAAELGEADDQQMRAAARPLVVPLGPPAPGWVLPRSVPPTPPVADAADHAVPADDPEE